MQSIAWIPGAGSDAQAFAPQLRAFPESVALTLPGRDGRPPASADSIEAFADAAAHELRARAFDGILVGHSMGGAVALELALRATPGVRAVVTLCSGARLRVAPAFFNALERDFVAGSAEFASYWFAHPRPERLEWAEAMLARVGQRQTIADLRACDAFDTGERLPNLSVPLLAIGAGDDRLVPTKFAAALADRVPTGEARIVERSGHFVNLERPEETNALLRAFTVRIDAG